MREEGEKLEFFQPEPTSETIRRHAWAQGYTEPRFNPKTMSWAWHKPDQALGDDGMLYIRASQP